MDKLLTRRDFLKVVTQGLPGVLAAGKLDKYIANTENPPFFTTEELEKLDTKSEKLYEDEECKLISFSIPTKKNGPEFDSLTKSLNFSRRELDNANITLLIGKGENTGDQTLTIKLRNNDVYIFHNSEDEPIKSMFLYNTDYYQFTKCELLKGGNFIKFTYSEENPIDSNIIFFENKKGENFNRIYSLPIGKRQRFGEIIPDLAPNTNINFHTNKTIYFQTNDRKLGELRQKNGEVLLDTFGYAHSQFKLNDIDISLFNPNSPLLFSGKNFIGYVRVSNQIFESGTKPEFVISDSDGNETSRPLDIDVLHFIQTTRYNYNSVPLCESISDSEQISKFSTYQPFSSSSNLLGIIKLSDLDTNTETPWIFIGKDEYGYKIFEWPHAVELINKIPIPDEQPNTETHFG